jgi:methylated-DNA-[protein]-cysteine S-methyltransferase
MQTRHTVIDSPLGELTLAANGDALTGLYFAHHWRRPAVDVLGRAVAPGADALFGHTADQLREYLTGRRTQFHLPIDLIGEARQRRVWELLLDIGYGETTTYGELATALADGTTAYEIGQAVGRNPLSIVVPCHRVVGKGGALTGYAGGLRRKRFLLELEAPVPAAAGRLF